MTTVLPWTISETGTEEVFDGLAPKLAGMGRMPLEAATMFGDGIISGIVPLVAKGKDEMHNVVKICREAIAFLDKHADSDAAETFDDTLGEIMRCLRVLMMIGDPYCMLWPHVVDAFDGHAAKRTKAAKSTLVYRVHFALKSNSAWWELHAEHVDRFEATVTHAAQIQQYIENLEGKDFQDALEEALFLQQVVKSMPVFLAECKKKVYGDFQLKFEEEIKKRVRNLFAAKNDFSEHCLASAMVTWRSILESVVQILPSMMTLCSDYLKKPAVWESELCKQRAMYNFDKFREVTTVDSFICEAKLSELHLAIRQLRVHRGSFQVQQLQSLYALAVDAVVKRCTSGEMEERVLELLRSVHGASFFPKDDVARKKVTQQEVWKRLSDAIREFENLGPDLPQRVAAPTAEAKVVEILALAKTFTRDPSLFERGTPIKCSRKKVRERRQVNQPGDDQAGFRSEVDGAGDIKAWCEQIPHDKTDNLEEKVMSIAQKTLLTLDGQLFSHKLEHISVANNRMQRVHELFDFKREDTESCDLIDRGLVTKYTSLMVHHLPRGQEGNEPSEAEAGDEKVQSSSAEFGRQGTARHWKWSSEAATFYVQASRQLVFMPTRSCKEKKS